MMNFNFGIRMPRYAGIRAPVSVKKINIFPVLEKFCMRIIYSPLLPLSNYFFANFLKPSICCKGRYVAGQKYFMCPGLKCLPTKIIIFHKNMITHGHRLNQMRLGKESPSFLIPVHCWGLGGGLVASFPRLLLLLSS